MKTFSEYIFESQTQALEKQKSELKTKLEKAGTDERQSIISKISKLDDKLRVLLNN